METFLYHWLLISTLISSVVCLDYDGWLNVRMDHNLNCGGAEFCPRGTISIKSIKSGASVIDQFALTLQHIEELKLLAEEEGFYTIRSFVTSAENKNVEYLSSMKASSFLNSGFSDEVNTWVLPNGAVIAVGFQVNNISVPLRSNKDKAYPINTKLIMNHIDHAPVPDTASYIQKLEREREAREKGELKDNRGFLAKYWMYIVPIGIFVLLSGATNPEGAQQGQR